MGTKRPHSEDVHPSRREQVPEMKKRKMNPHPNRKLDKKAHPVNPLKSRIRSLERLLKHRENLPADVRLNHERELASCKWELEEAEKGRRKQEFIGKYHMVRFFDRQKATRRLKQVQKKAKDAEGTEDEDVLAEKVHEAQVDLNYTQYYPLDMAYSALFPGKTIKSKKGKEVQEGSADNEAEKLVEKQGDPDMWKLVEKCMEQGKLDALRNGKLLKGVSSRQDDDMAPTSASKGKKAKEKADKVKAKKAKQVKEQSQQQEEDEESDGGFFE
ncbi:hypothetical protein MBLNU459_g6516t1 [Dothideomycetes sp. NU459]